MPTTALRNDSTCGPAPPVALVGDDVFSRLSVFLYSVSLGCGLLIAVTHLLSNDVRTVVKHFVFMLAVLDVVLSSLFIVEIYESDSWYQRPLNPPPSCQIEMFIYGSSTLGMGFLYLALALYLAAVVYFGRTPPYFTTVFLTDTACLVVGSVFTYIMWLVVGFSPQNNYVLSGGCTPHLTFVVNGDGKCVTSEQTFWCVFMLFYVWLFVDLGGVLACFLLIARRTRQARRRRSKADTVVTDVRYQQSLKLMSGVALVGVFYFLQRLPASVSFITSHLHGPREATTLASIGQVFWRLNFLQSVALLALYIFLCPDFYRTWLNLLTPALKKLPPFESSLDFDRLRAITIKEGDNLIVDSQELPPAPTND